MTSWLLTEDRFVRRSAMRDCSKLMSVWLLHTKEMYYVGNI